MLVRRGFGHGTGSRLALPRLDTHLKEEGVESRPWATARPAASVLHQDRQVAFRRLHKAARLRQKSAVDIWAESVIEE